MPDLPRLPRSNLSLSPVISRGVGGRSGRRVVETRKDAIPEKLYYVPLPQLPPLRMPDLPFSAAMGRGVRSWDSGRRVVETWASHTPGPRVMKRWWASHTVDLVVWTLVMSLAVVVGIVVARL
jgi:hypothetical protein